MGGTLAGKAQEIYDQLTDTEQEIARRVFIGLVQLGEGTRDTRRRTKIKDLIASQDELQKVKEVISQFSSPGARLITLSSQTVDEKEVGEIAEVTHEALIDSWQLLKDWLDESRDDIRFQRRLEAAASYWDKQKRPKGLLWRSPDLELLRTFERKKRSDMTSLSVAFFEASEQAKKREVLSKNWSAAMRVMSFFLFAVGVYLALHLYTLHLIIKFITTDCSGLEPMEQQQSI